MSKAFDTIDRNLDDRMTAALVAVLRLLRQEQEQSPDCFSWYMHMVRVLVAKIEEEVPKIAQDDPCRANGIIMLGPGGRKRRIDEEYKRVVVQAVMEGQRARTPQAFVRVDGGVAPSIAAAWMSSMVAALRISQMLSFDSAQCVSLAFDAGRFGQPKEDVVLIAATMPAKRAGVLVCATGE